MNFLMIGDVVGRVGRNALHSNLTEIKKKFEIDFTIVNAENSAAGFGLTLYFSKLKAEQETTIASGSKERE